MADPLRPASTRLPDGISEIERDTRIETLLLCGLDHYFAGDHERAISVWTRVLFLDRGHARARAYIERARSAVAERQRESDELLHRGMAAFERGEAGVARRLLAAAVERGGPHEVALAYLDRLDRLDAAPSTGEVAVEPPKTVRATPRTPAPRPVRPRRSWLLPLVILGLLGWGASYVAASWDWLAALLFLRQPWSAAVRPAAAVPVEDPLPVPRSAEITLRRAHAASSSGHLRDALQLLALISQADPLRAEADRLRSDIQRALLSGSRSAATLGLTPGPAAPAPGSPSVVRNE